MSSGMVNLGDISCYGIGQRSESRFANFDIVRYIANILHSDSTTHSGNTHINAARDGHPPCGSAAPARGSPPTGLRGGLFSGISLNLDLDLDLDLAHDFFCPRSDEPSTSALHPIPRAILCAALSYRPETHHRRHAGHFTLCY